MELGSIEMSKQMAILGVFAVNGGVWLFWFLLRRLAPDIHETGFLGVYFILVPIGFLAWFDAGNLTLWAALAMSMFGLVIMSRAGGFARARLADRQ
jgi:hypothetical protein